MEEGCIVDGKFFNLEVENLLTAANFTLHDPVYNNLTINNNLTVGENFTVDTNTLKIDSTNKIIETLNTLYFILFLIIIFVKF